MTGWRIHHRGGHRNSFDRPCLSGVGVSECISRWASRVLYRRNRDVEPEAPWASFEVLERSIFGVCWRSCASATFLSLMRWSENYHLFILGAMSFACAWIGRAALRRRWRYWVRLHIAGMGLSYVLMLIAFYVDNGKQLPLWKDLPHFMYWLIPMAVGIPLIVRALLWPPLERSPLAAAKMRKPR